MADGGMVEVDLDVERQAVAFIRSPLLRTSQEIRRRKFREGGAALDAHGLEDFDGAALGRLRDDAGLVDRRDEGRRGAVEHRNFRPVHLDQGVVDAQARQRRHGVFDGRDRVAAPKANGRAEFGRNDARPERRGDRLGRQIAAQQEDARIGFRRVQQDARRLAGMDADALERDGGGKSSLQVPARVGDAGAARGGHGAFCSFETGHPLPVRQGCYPFAECARTPRFGMRSTPISGARAGQSGS